MRSTLIAVLMSAAFPLAAHPATISPKEAANHVGQRETVCGVIAGEHTAYRSRGTPTFINLDRPYPNQDFTIVVWGDDRASVGQLPSSGQLCVTGYIKQYRGVPEVDLRGHTWYVPQ
jgi:hypothetical protein